ncbi:MAG: hypothetical protein KDI16_01955 [Halioglobus sp.]|nr:hypothetical protein [Halioglobus sp.]
MGSGSIAVARRAGIADNSAAEKHAISLPKFFMVLGQLILLLLCVRQFQIESDAFLQVFVLVIAGFCVHYFLPFAWRIHWFLALSIASIFLVFGWTNALWMILIGCGLIFLCHVPIAYRYRIALIAAAAVVLGTLRTSSIALPFSAAVWPILGSMFMYRMIVYLYDLKHDRVPLGLSHRLAYFFMLPNVCFPLFPVVDSNNFRRLYYSEERHATYQTGVVWITRGIIHLLLYRYVYYYLTVAPADVVNAGSLIQFLVANFLLYLRVSGLFHLVIGLLHLFGFALPETHKLYYLSSSFTDFWRRINIYWKDFMMKVFYYPVYFRLKRFGSTSALVWSTLLVFLLTWMLHSYQWFWLRGSFPIEWQDGVFWGLLAVVVVINSVWEINTRRSRALGAVRWYSKRSLGKSVRIILVFASICSMWSLWTCESMEEWLDMWSVLARSQVTLAGLLLGAIGFVVAVLTISVIDSSMSNARQQQITNKGDRGPFSSRRMTATVLQVILLAAIGLPQVYTMLNADAANFILSLRSEKLSRTDTQKLEKGYYEDLIRVDRFNSQLWEVYSKKPVDWLAVTGSGLKQFRDDFLQEELRPSSRSLTEHGDITTNEWGMRDQSYSKAPDAGSFRMALLGASSVMGWGVADSETFDAVLEKKLNSSAVELGYDKVEILNFGVAGYYPLQQIMALDYALEFQPQAVFYIATGREYRRAAYYLYDVIAKQIAIPYPYLRDLAARAGIDSSTTETEALRRLRPYDKELLQWLYREIVARCRAHAITPVWVFLPQVNRGRWEENVAETVQDAKDAGFATINLLDVYGSHPIEQVQLTEWDFHPNALGHNLVAQRLYRELLDHRDVYFAR